jgi:dephospho-CoA kinase
MKTIGIIGGVASGKSTVARMLVELGAGLLDADRTGHQVLAKDAEVGAALRQRWGDSVLHSDGSVDRTALAATVFASTDQAAADREFLETLLHPRIGRRLAKLRDQYAAEGRPAVVLDAPLLLEAGWGPMCDLVVMVDAPRELRLARAAERGWSEAEFARREAAQWPVDDKRREAHLLVANDGTENELRSAMRHLWARHIKR